MDDTDDILAAPTPQHVSTTAAHVPGLATHEDLTPQEQAVLEEYERLAENMKRLAAVLDGLAGQPATATLDGLRELERKTSLVFTLLKASVYSIVLQHQIDGGE